MVKNHLKHSRTSVPQWSSRLLLKVWLLLDTHLILRTRKPYSTFLFMDSQVLSVVKSKHSSVLALLQFVYFSASKHNKAMLKWCLYDVLIVILYSHQNDITVNSDKVFLLKENYLLFYILLLFIYLYTLLIPSNLSFIFPSLTWTCVMIYYFC